MSGKENLWEKAYLQKSHDAAMGRLFRGLIHNLNGVGQAFSMQTELLGMMFSQSHELLDEILAAGSLEDARQGVEQLREFIDRRAGLVDLLEEKTRVLNEVMTRTNVLIGDTLTTTVTPFTIKEVVETEVEFLSGDMFFKHRVTKELHLTNNLPHLHGYRCEIHKIVFVLLLNAKESMEEAGTKKPGIKVETGFDGKKIHIIVEDNGPGMQNSACEKIFEAFYTTKESHAGLGLYMARKMAADMDGEISCSLTAGKCGFTLSIPAEKVAGYGKYE